MGLAAVGTAAAVGSLGLGVYSATQSGGGGGGYSGTSGGSGSQFYIPNNLGGQDTNFQNQQNYITGQSPWGTISPMYQSVMNNLYNDPYAAAYQGGAQNVANDAFSLSGQNWGNMSTLEGLGGMATMAPGLYSQVANNPYYGLAMGESQVGGQNLMNVGQGAYNQSGSIGQANMGALPGLSSTLDATMNNPYNAQTIGAAAQGGGLVQGQALSDYANAGSLGGAGSSILNTAFDPQNALYGQLFQQNQDQTQAALAQAGLGTSGAGVGVMDNSNQNFNIAWQNAQLGRQQQGLSAAEGAYSGASGLGTGAGTNYAAGGAMPGTAYNAVQNTNQAALTNYLSGVGALGQNAQGADTLGAQGAQQLIQGGAMPYNLYQSNLNNQIGAYGQLGNAANTYGGLYTTAANLGNVGLNQAQTGITLPYNTSQTIYGNQGNALTNYENAYLTAMTPYQQSLANSMQYMGLGTQAQNAYSAAQNRSWQQGQQNMQNIGSALQGFGNAASNGTLTNAYNGISNLFGGGSSSGMNGVTFYNPSSSYTPTNSNPDFYSPSVFDFSGGFS